MIEETAEEWVSYNLAYAAFRLFREADVELVAAMEKEEEDVVREK